MFSLKWINVSSRSTTRVYSGELEAFGGKRDLNIDSSLYFGEGDLDLANLRGSNGSIGFLLSKVTSM